MFGYFRYLRTKSTGKKKPLATTFGGMSQIGATQGNMDELMGLCSGKFMGNVTKYVSLIYVSGF